MYLRDTGIDLLPSITMFEVLSTTVSVLLQNLQLNLIILPKLTN